MTSLQAKRKDELLLICKEKKISGVYKKKKKKLTNFSKRAIIKKQKMKPNNYKNKNAVI